MIGKAELNFLYQWNCVHPRSPSEFAEREFAKPGSVTDPRNALLRFMIEATHYEVGSEIYRKRHQFRKNMTFWPKVDCLSDDCGVIVQMIDNVPKAIAPVKATTVYIQLHDGDKTTLLKCWKVSMPSSISPTGF